MASPSPGHLGAILARVLGRCDQQTVSVGALVSSFGRAGILPLMLLPALIVVSPLSVIPLLPAVNGLIIALAALQLAAGRKYLWLPGWLSRQTLPTQRLKSGVRRMAPFAAWIDGRTRARLEFLTAPPISWLIALMCAVCGLAMPFLELFPMSSTLLGATVVCLGLGLLVRDGALILLALLPFGLAAKVIFSLM